MQLGVPALFCLFYIIITSSFLFAGHLGHPEKSCTEAVSKETLTFFLSLFFSGKA